MTKILPVIMCGGAGTRVWPVARESLPKQFIPLVGERSTFQDTILRLDPAVFDQPIILTNADYRFFVQDQLAEIGRSAQIILEPERRDSAAAVAVACAAASAESKDAIVAIFAADHVIQDCAEFQKLCRKAAEAAQEGYIVTLGAPPTFAATGYGYIRPGAPIAGESGARNVEAFIEKPDQAKAEAYLKEGYLWNSGNFFFRADIMAKELHAFAPDIAHAATEAFAKAETQAGFKTLDAEAFKQAPKTSIDYAVMERTAHAAVIPAAMGWSDIGSWGSVWDLSDRDVHGNSIRGDGVILNSANVHVRGDHGLTTVVGAKDVIVVTTEDAVLVVGTEHGDKVKKLVEQLNGKQRKETREHKLMHRPWGYYRSIDSGPRHQVKRIVVKPGHKLSLQKHFHREEHWIVVRGAAEVTRNDEVHMVHEKEAIHLPIGVVHRLYNPGKIDLELIEVQIGSYLGEDDIVRLEDVYHRS